MNVFLCLLNHFQFAQFASLSAAYPRRVIPSPRLLILLHLLLLLNLFKAKPLPRAPPPRRLTRYRLQRTSAEGADAMTYATCPPTPPAHAQSVSTSRMILQSHFLLNSSKKDLREPPITSKDVDDIAQHLSHTLPHALQPHATTIQLAATARAFPL